VKMKNISNGLPFSSFIRSFVPTLLLEQEEEEEEVSGEGKEAGTPKPARRREGAAAVC